MIAKITDKPFRVCLFSAFVSVALVSCGRAGVPTSPQIQSLPQTAAVNNAVPAQHLIAFSPTGTPSIAVYPAAASGDVKPSRLLKGAKTTLAWGNSVGVDSSGTIYAIVGSPLRLLEFAPKATGDTAPEHVVDLPKSLLSGYSVGFAPDNRGNFFLSNAPKSKVMRFPILKQGSAQSNAAFVPKLLTPDGLLDATPVDVAVGPNGILYVLAHVLANGGAEATGVSQYSVDAAGAAKLVRSFYDLNLPEAPPCAIAVDKNGTVYLAGGIASSPIFAYAPNAQSGSTSASRIIGHSSKVPVSSIATDDARQLYVAVPGRVDVYGPDANGEFVKPVRALIDAKDLEFGNGAYGSLLALTGS